MVERKTHPFVRDLLLCHDREELAKKNSLMHQISAVLFGADVAPCPSQDIPSWVAPIERRLDQIEKVLTMVSQNTAKVAADWPQVKQAITDKLQADAEQIKALMTERDALKAEEAGHGLSDEEEAKLGEVDKQMNDLLNNLHGVVAAQPDPTPAAQASGTAASGTDANTAAGTHATTSAGGDPAQGAAPTGGPSAGAGTNVDIQGSVAGAKSA